MLLNAVTITTTFSLLPDFFLTASLCPIFLFLRLVPAFVLLSVQQVKCLSSINEKSEKANQSEVHQINVGSRKIIYFQNHKEEIESQTYLRRTKDGTFRHDLGDNNVHRVSSLFLLPHRRCHYIGHKISICNLSTMISLHFVSLLVLLPLLVNPSMGFSTLPSTALHQSADVSSSSSWVGTKTYLYIDSSNDSVGGYSLETIESIKSNEWGIPSSNTLPPLSPIPRNELDNGGKVTLVGSGPGDPDLLTLKAHKLLQDPDALVIVDRLVSQEIVDIIRGEIKIARKLPGCAELAQEEIYWWTHQGLAAGKHVIRLKIGDPFVFGRGGEEVIQFRKFGVESKVIPVRDIQVSWVFFYWALHHVLAACWFLI